VKTREQAEARRLRAVEGRSVREIATLLGVSRSSVSLWVRGVELSESQHAALRARDPAYNGHCAGSQANAALALARWRAYQREGRLRAASATPEYAAGCMLFWAEGSRSPNSVRLTNSDPELLRFFALFLRGSFDVADERFRVACNLFVDHEERQREVEQVWLDVLRLPRSCLTKTTVNRYSVWSNRKRTNKLPYGTCRLTVNDTRIAHVLYGSIQELAGFARPEWLELRG
jgi:hypothetical protein